jgi:Toprim domain/CHC2 zinc finger
MRPDILGTARLLGATLKKVSASEFAGPCPRCGGTDRFAVNLRKQIWNCRGCGTGGDSIDLVRLVNDCGYRDALVFLGGESAPQRPTGAHRPPSEPRRDDERDRAQAARYAQEKPALRGTDGERYLQQTRGLDTGALDVLDRVDAIGWHPAVYIREEGHKLNGQRIGAIVAVLSDPVSANPTGAVSRTYVDGDLRKIAKARTLGAPTGIVRLSRDEDVLGGLFLAEGLETALAAMALGLRPIWSTGSTAEMARFPVLNGIEALTVIADNDRKGGGEKAARAVEARWRGAGREVRIFRSDRLGDLNDAIAESSR